MQVFLECDYRKVEEILTLGLKFPGYVKTTLGTYRAEFSVTHSQVYVEEIYHLYKLFVKNGIPWKTIHMPYAYKMIDISMVSCEADFNQEKKIEEISVDFREFSGYIRYDVVLLWNVEPIQAGSVGFPIPCEDHRIYEHTISIEGATKESAFLIENSDVTIQHIRRDGPKVTITCDTDEIQEWTIYQIHADNRRKTDFVSYPVLSNQKLPSLAGNLQERNPVLVRTRGELIRCLEGFEDSHYFEFVGYDILDLNDEASGETYSMNPFIEDEIRHEHAKKRLVIHMREKEKDNFLSRDILSFLISEIQLLFPEYHCEGRLL